MAGGIAFDWRGTPIKEGAKVVTHGRGKFPQRAIGIVTRVGDKTITAKVLERDKSYHYGAHVTLGHASVTVLTPDLFESAE